MSPVHVIPPDQYEAFDVDTKLECIRALIPLGLMQVHSLLEEKVSPLTGDWHARGSPSFPGRRYGSNPGSAWLV